PLARVFRKQRQCPRPRGAILQNLDRPPPSQFLSVVDLTQIQHLPLQHAPAGDACVLDNAPIAMLLAILPADFATQEHDGRQLSAYWRRRDIDLVGTTADFRAFGPRRSL